MNVKGNTFYSKQDLSVSRYRLQGRQRVHHHYMDGQRGRSVEIVWHLFDFKLLYMMSALIHPLLSSYFVP